MIPKIIHYCWFGGKPKPELVQRCLASWEKHCPDYELKELNESNYDLHDNAFAEEAYAQKKWAFVADVARLRALVTDGGIYLMAPECRKMKNTDLHCGRRFLR